MLREVLLTLFFSLDFFFSVLEPPLTIRFPEDGCTTSLQKTNADLLYDFTWEGTQPALCHQHAPDLSTEDRLGLFTWNLPSSILSSRNKRVEERTQLEPFVFVLRQALNFTYSKAWENLEV